MTMKREEEKNKVQTTQNQCSENQEITSALIENAHASGDGAVKKTDELSLSEDNEKKSTDTPPY
jgi:hypothetical protein